MNSKPLWESKTFWVNIIGLLIEVAILFTDTFKSNPEMTLYVGSAIGVLNIILRSITKQPVHVSEPVQGSDLLSLEGESGSRELEDGTVIHWRRT